MLGRRRELDRAMDAAMKSRGQRRSKKDGEVSIIPYLMRHGEGAYLSSLGSCP